MSQVNVINGCQITHLNCGEWHAAWQNKFPHHWLEKKYGNRRADVNIEDGDVVLEVQNSRIKPEEVASRNEDYAKHGKDVIWIVNGKSCGAQMIKRTSVHNDQDDFLLVLTKPGFMDQFGACDKVLLHIDDKVFVVRPEDFRKGTIRVRHSWSVDKIVEILMQPGRHGELQSSTVKSEVRVWQYPPGSGKTYRVVNGVITGEKGFETLDTVLLLTKPHSAKEVIKEEFQERLKENGIHNFESDEINKAYWYKFEVNGRSRTVILATMDSFIYSVKDGEADTSVMDQFEAICKTISNKGPMTGKRGEITFKNQSIKLNGTCLIVVDEATKLSPFYLDALARITFTCNANALVVGDKMQSIESPINLLTVLLDGHKSNDLNVIKDEPGNTIRRFGPVLVNFLNSIVPWAKYNLPIPVAADPEKEGSFEVHPLQQVYEREDIRREVMKIINQLQKDVDDLLLLPNDVIIVSPFVTKNPLLDELGDEIHEFWKHKLDQIEYREGLVSSGDEDTNTRNQEYLDWYDNVYKNPQRWNGLLAIRHYSDGGQPVNTSTSRMRTRMVSIHAAQGDGRQYCMTIGLNEMHLKRFTRNQMNLQFESLLNVALSRAKKKLVVYVTPKYDLVWERFVQYMDSETQNSVEPKFNISNHLKLTSESINFDENTSELIHANVIPCIENHSSCNSPPLDYICHVIRARTYSVVFFLRALEKSETADQFVIKVKQLLRAAIVPCDTAKDYYKFLEERTKQLKNGDDVTSIPLRRYNKNTHNFNAIHKATEDARHVLRTWINGTPQWELLQNDVLVSIMIWYMIDFESNGKYLITQMVVIYDITNAVKISHELFDQKTFYETIKCATLTFERVVETMPTGTWLLEHRVTHGQPDGDRLPFQTYVTIPFMIYNTELKSICAIFLRPQVNEMNLAEIASTSLFTRRVVEQPMTKGNRNCRFADSRVHTIFVDTTSGMIYQISNNYMTNDMVDSLITMSIKEHCQQHHASVEKFHAYHGGGVDAFDAYEKCLKGKRSDAPYVKEAFKEAKRGKKTIRDALNESLDDHLDDYTRQAKRPNCTPA